MTMRIGRYDAFQAGWRPGSKLFLLSSFLYDICLVAAPTASAISATIVVVDMMVVMVIAIAVASIVVCVLSSLTPVSDVCPTFMNVISVLHLPSICRNSVTSAEVGAMPDPVVRMGGPKEVAVTMKKVIIVR